MNENSYLWNLVKFVWHIRDTYIPKFLKDTEKGALEEPEKVKVFVEKRIERFPGASPGEYFDLPIHNWLYLRYEPKDFRKGGKLWKLMTQYYDAVRLLRDEVEKKGGEFVLTWLPSRERVYLPLLPPERRKKYITNKSGDIDGYEQSLRIFTKKEGMHFVDLTPGLIKTASQGQNPYFIDNHHLNSLGHNEAGKILSNYLWDSGILKKESAGSHCRTG